MALSALTGVISAAIYQPGYYPQGTDVMADLVAIIAKQSDVIDQVNTNETDISTNTSAIAAEVATRAADIAEIQSDVDTNTAAIDVLVSSAGNKATLLLAGGTDRALTLSDVEQYFCFSVYGGSRIALPASAYRELVDNHVNPSMVMIHNASSASDVWVSLAAGESWADGVADGDYTNGRYYLAPGEYVICMPVYTSENVNGRWLCVSDGTRLDPGSLELAGADYDLTIDQVQDYDVIYSYGGARIMLPAAAYSTIVGTNQKKVHPVTIVNTGVSGTYVYVSCDSSETWLDGAAYNGGETDGRFRLTVGQSITVLPCDDGGDGKWALIGQQMGTIVTGY